MISLKLLLSRQTGFFSVTGRGKRCITKILTVENIRI